jgi:hypothetical protein
MLENLENLYLERAAWLAIWNENFCALFTLDDVPEIEF